MTKLELSIAVGDYDRVRPLADGSVQIDGVNPVFMLLEPEEIFFRAFRHADFDLCELSMSSFTVKTAIGDCPYVGVPVFPSRAFRHNSIYIRTDRGIARPEDLRGRRIGVPEYQVTANVWTRLMLEEEYRRPAVRRRLGTRRLRTSGADREDRVEPAAGRARGRCAGGHYDLTLARRGGDRRGDRSARAVVLHGGSSARRLAVSGSGRRRRRVVPQDADFSNHACAGRAPLAGGTPSVVACGCNEGIRTGEGTGAGEAAGHYRQAR